MADAPHAKYAHHACRLKARNDRLHSREPLKRKGVKMNNCLGHNCTAKVYPPRHFCRRCRDLKQKYPSYADGVWGGGVI